MFVGLKKYINDNVYNKAVERISNTLDNVECAYVSFSGGKDSSVLYHLLADECRSRGIRIGVLIVDLEAQYIKTIEHIKEIIKENSDITDLYWVSLPIKLRNAVSNYSPSWTCWDVDQKEKWIRSPDKESITDVDYFDFFEYGMEFEEFVPLFGEWYAKGKKCACFVGIRADESLNRFRTIASNKKTMLKNMAHTTQVTDNVFNSYPIYDWKTQDIWVYTKKFNKSFNQVYEYMTKAGLSIHQQRLCQPYGDDQRRGLWLYHIIEPQTWFKVVNRVSGVNSGSLYINENGNITGYDKISCPEGHNWESFSVFLLNTLPINTRRHYKKKIDTFISWWKGRGYHEGIPQEAPSILEAKKLVPSYKRICKTILRNDYWCKGLSFTQPKSNAWNRFKKMELEKREKS